MLDDMNILQSAAFILDHGGHQVETAQVRAVIAEMKAARRRESYNSDNQAALADILIGAEHKHDDDEIRAEFGITFGMVRALLPIVDQSRMTSNLNLEDGG